MLKNELMLSNEEALKILIKHNGDLNKAVTEFINTFN